MARKQQEEGGANWMDTYGDMVTLLLTFFVMLYSMSTVNEEKWAMLVRAFNIHGKEVVDQIVFGHSSEDGSEPFENAADQNTVGQQNKPVNSQLDELLINIQKYVEQHDMEESISVSNGNEGIGINSTQDPQESSGSNSSSGEKPNNIYIQFKNDVLFMPDKSEMREEAIEIIDFLGECLKSVDDEVAMIIIKGHTAISPTSIVDSRLLSTDRAGVISNYLENNFEIASTKLYPIGLGEDYPIATNDTEEGRAQNRRVEIVIISKESDLAKSGELLKILGASFEADEGDIQEIAGN